MPPEFAKPVVDLVAKRAAYFCSNPDCGCLTVGANSHPEKATLVGEAAHIFGARCGSFRFRPEMTDAERAASTNALWLCSLCHTKIDKDEIIYPSDLLFMWKIKRENSSTQMSGNAGEILRSEYNAEEMRAFNDLPIYARQLIVTKPDKWEYFLTAELMLHYLKPTMQKKYELEFGLYTVKNLNLPNFEFLTWIQMKFAEVVQVCAALLKVLNEFQKSWGPTGVSGDPHRIKRNCELYSKCGQRFLELAEEVTFAKHPEHFEGIRELFVAGALHPLKEFEFLPQRLRALVDSVEQDGVYRLEMLIELPEGWEDEMSNAVAEAERRVLLDVE